MTLIYILMALAPAFAIALYIYWKDTHEKEPVGVLVMCFIFGVLICFFTAENQAGLQGFKKTIIFSTGTGIPMYSPT